MNPSYYKNCIVPQCTSTSINTPNKLFIYVPNDPQIRKKWLTLARRIDADCLSTKSRMYFCEDHFDLRNDMLNYTEYHIMGQVSQVRLIPGCTPSKFVCQENSKKWTYNSTERSIKFKKQRKMITAECLNERKESSVPSSSHKNTPHTSSVSHGCKVLKKGAVPSLFIPSDVESEDPASIQISKVISLKKDLIKDLFPQRKFGQCRCCLNNGEHEISNIGEMLECLNIQVSTNSHLPTLICSDCEKFLQEAKRFRDMVSVSQKTLLSALPKDNITDPIHTTEVTVKIECEPDTSEVEEECQSRTSEVKDECESGTSEVKEEIIEPDDGSTTMETQLAVLKRYLSCDVTIGVHIETPQDIEKNDSLLNNPEGDIEEEREFIDEGNLSDLSDHFDTEFDDSVFKEILTPAKLFEMARNTDAEFSQQLRENITTVLQNSTVVPFTSKRDEYACLYCIYSSKTFDDIRTHTQTEHQALESDVIMHALKVHSVKVDPDLVIRVDISSLECIKCGLPFDDVKELVEHLQLFHDTILHDLNRDPPYNILCFDMGRDDFCCLVCDKKFSFFKGLLAHMNQHYGSFLCPVCGGKFLHEVMYKKHVAQELEGGVRHQCSACDANYVRKNKLFEHTKAKHPDIAKLWRIKRGRF